MTSTKFGVTIVTTGESFSREEKTIKTIIAGGRNINYSEPLLDSIRESGFEITEVVSGTAKGVDKLGEEWALNNLIPVISFPADWSDLTSPDAVVRYSKFGKPYNAVAGHLRNEKMAEYADSLILIWDGSSSGSSDMLRRAKIHGLKIHEKIVNIENLRKENITKDYNKVLNWAKDRRINKNAVVIDTESCGGSKNDEIISIGIVRLYDGKILFESLLKPCDDVHFNYYATRVHGITKSSLANAPKLPDVWDKIYPLLHNNEVLAYNSSSDNRMILQTAYKYRLTIPDIKWYCIMKAYKQYTKRSSPTNLTEACSEMKVKAGTHDAIDDALAAARLVYRMEQMYQPDINEAKRNS